MGRHRQDPVVPEMSMEDFISYMEALSPMERVRLQDRARLTRHFARMDELSFG